MKNKITLRPIMVMLLILVLSISINASHSTDYGHPSIYGIICRAPGDCSGEKINTSDQLIVFPEEIAANIVEEQEELEVINIFPEKPLNILIVGKVNETTEHLIHIKNEDNVRFKLTLYGSGNESEFKLEFDKKDYIS